jgi:hypothetical protein
MRLVQTLALIGLTLGATAQDGEKGVDYDAFEVSRLRCVIGNNAPLGEHAGRYNGLFSLWAPDQAESPFVPTYAGWNLEHYFDARPRHHDGDTFFEPRTAPMTFTRINATTAELYQPQTPHFGVESWSRFEVREPYYVDFSFRAVAHKPLEGGFLGVFWASYINGSLDKSLYFLSAGSDLDQPRWVQLCTQAHDRDSTVLPAAGDAGITFQEGGSTLWNNISPLKYGVPAFYGRFRNMVLIYIFEPGPHIRLTHSPSGGGTSATGDDTNPAWDFQFFVPHVELKTAYSFRGRLIYRPWTNREDVLLEMRKFLTGLDKHTN